MAATNARRRVNHPVSYYWDKVKDLDNSQKLELVTMLIESVKTTVAPAPAPMKRYTMDEINAMLDESERQLVNGQWQDFDEAMDELEKEFVEEERKLEPVAAV